MPQFLFGLAPGPYLFAINNKESLVLVYIGLLPTTPIVHVRYKPVLSVTIIENSLFCTSKEHSNENGMDVTLTEKDVEVSVTNCRYL